MWLPKTNAELANGEFGEVVFSGLLTTRSISDENGQVTIVGASMKLAFRARFVLVVANESSGVWVLTGAGA